MKITSILFLLVLSGCSWPIKTVYVSVYKTPEITMPSRPILKSNGGDINTVTKNAEKDLIDLEGYANQLENILVDLKSGKTINKEKNEKSSIKE